MITQHSRLTYSEHHNSIELACQDAKPISFRHHCDVFLPAFRSHPTEPYAPPSSFRYLAAGWQSAKSQTEAVARAQRP